MEYRHLGKSGLKVSELSFGSWITFADTLDLERVKKSMRAAFDAGINFFDNAEVYAQGTSERLMGEVLKDYKREDVVISTKIFWGGNGPNDNGLSMKHLIEGTKNSLKRLQLDYVDLLFCHRPDPSTPIEETVRAMDILIKSGYAFYWGTSEWSAEEIERAYTIAQAIGATPPTMEQPEYNLFHREKVEKELLPLYSKFGLGTTIWSPLASGLLTGKYNQGIPKGSRFYSYPELQGKITQATLQKLNDLKEIADSLSCSMAQLSLAWCLKNPHVSTVITGASHVDQLKENLEAVKIKQHLTPEIMKKINNV